MCVAISPAAFCYFLTLASQASYSAEQSAQDADSIDKAKDEQIRQLESLLQDYKSRTQELERELDELSHHPLPATEKQGPRLQELKEALEKDRQALKEVQKGQCTGTCRVYLLN